MDYEIRDYTEKDYTPCSELVCRAWNFDAVFQPSEFTALAKSIYTGGAEIESTFKSVAVQNGEVIGFIFGMNRTLYKAKLHLKFRLKVLWKIYKIKHSTPTTSELIAAMSEQEKNRSAFVPKKRSEIVLFVVSEAHQGKGVGIALWGRFLRSCIELSESTVYVETNKRGASRFYEKIGFTHVADFHSPLHEFATPNGQACIYSYRLKNEHDVE